MDTSDFQRARSPEAKQQREDAILAAARSLGAKRRYPADHPYRYRRHGRHAQVGRAALLRDARADLPAPHCRGLARMVGGAAREIGEDRRLPDREDRRVRLLHDTGRPRHVLRPARPGAAEPGTKRVPGSRSAPSSSSPTAKSTPSSRSCDGTCPASPNESCIDIIATATSLSGAFWQMANPAPEVAALYRSDPRMMARTQSSRSNRACAGYSPRCSEEC